MARIGMNNLPYAPERLAAIWRTLQTINPQLAATPPPEFLNEATIRRALAAVAGDPETVEPADITALIQRTDGPQALHQLARFCHDYKILLRLPSLGLSHEPPEETRAYALTAYALDPERIPDNSRWAAQPEFAVELVARNPRCWAYLPTSIKFHPDVITSRLRADWTSLSSLIRVSRWNGNREPFRLTDAQLLAVMSDPDAQAEDILIELHSTLPDTVLEATRQALVKTGEIWRYFAPVLTHYADATLATLAQTHVEVLWLLSPAQREAVWPSLRAALAEAHLDFPAAWLHDAKSLMDGIRSFTSHPSHFATWPTLFTIWRNSTQPRPADSTGPVVAVLSATHDWNGAFRHLPLHRFLQQGAYVIYREGRTTDMLTDASFAALTADGRGPIQTLLLAGHGSPEGIVFGNPPTSDADPDPYVLDTQDLAEGDLNHLTHYLTATSHVVLFSCATAKGGRVDTGNFANRLAERLPPSARVHASRQNIILGSLLMLSREVADMIDLLPDGNVIVRWNPYTPYTIRGRRALSVALAPTGPFTAAAAIAHPLPARHPTLVRPLTAPTTIVSRLRRSALDCHGVALSPDIATPAMLESIMRCYLLGE